MGLNPVLYGVRCRDCAASIPAKHPNIKDATRAWNKRSGLASVGGKATKGIRSRRKLAAARRNLKTARQWKLVRLRVETAYATLRPYRVQELAKLEATAAEDRAWLQEREPLIMADPVLRQLYDLLPSRKTLGTNADTASNP